MKFARTVHGDESNVTGCSPTPLLNIANAVFLATTAAVTYVVSLPAGLTQLIRIGAALLAVGLILLALIQFALQKMSQSELTF